MNISVVRCMNFFYVDLCVEENRPIQFNSEMTKTSSFTVEFQVIELLTFISAHVFEKIVECVKELWSMRKLKIHGRRFEHLSFPDTKSSLTNEVGPRFEAVLC